MAQRLSGGCSGHLEQLGEAAGLSRSGIVEKCDPRLGYSLVLEGQGVAQIFPYPPPLAK